MGTESNPSVETWPKGALLCRVALYTSRNETQDGINFLSNPTPIPKVTLSIPSELTVNSSPLFTWITISAILQLFCFVFSTLMQDFTFLLIKFSFGVSDGIFIPSSLSPWKFTAPNRQTHILISGFLL